MCVPCLDLNGRLSKNPSHRHGEAFGYSPSGCYAVFHRAWDLIKKHILIVMRHRCAMAATCPAQRMRLRNAKSTNGNSGYGERLKTHRFRLPTLDVAAAEFRAQQKRDMRGPIGCLSLLAGISLIATFLLFFDVGSYVVLGGLTAIILGVILMRVGSGFVFA